VERGSDDNEPPNLALVMVGSAVDKLTVLRTVHGVARGTSTIKRSVCSFLCTCGLDSAPKPAGR
jgi:hypothetical protein